MNTEKINFDLKGVPHTLLLPLLGRAAASQDKTCPFKDAQAVKLVQSLEYDFANLSDKMGSFFGSLTWAGERANYFDKEVEEYLKTHPKATIVNFGAGLETAFYRVDNGQLTWVDLDVPEVISLRKKLLPAPKRVHYIAKSIFDYSWIDDVKKLGKDVFFFAGGVFIYFTPEQVKSLFLEMSKHFSGAEVVFDSIPKTELANANAMFKKLDMFDVKFQWGIDEKEVKSWSPKLKIVYHKVYAEQNHFRTDELAPFKGYMTKIGF